ncbi:Stk1 family PASTA domain-containing Ser/Thr kinase [Anaeromicropila populeti]|uniref:non-specific serine/threonine protein kinase n=1 Tax=Anaeromicropila populeti TaxID=37658 RepID=A0A1I6KWR6_9FIRM|nr:Stk1 family PASTA domain-containing Ser/Thr kinase [Anaeromicropila populeti]SFR95627.1 serine/threonine protein kinase [Anaeromicropila populeti]
MIKPGMFISDRYEIIEKVGTGGMADVYKAKCHRLNRYVAIKVLKAEFSEDKSFVSKFRGEAQSAAGLSHPNIVNVYDVGDDDGLHYIVMELVEGITLKSFIERKGKLEIREALGIAIQISQGMEAAHANHIIHRDIKPQNIIISKEGKVKVTDFGIAKAASSHTITSNAMGSVHYISPEQARGGYCDEKSDIYSLGITMYEMLTGRVPFTGDNTISVALLHIQGEAISIRELEPTIPVSIDKIVQKCMQKKPERRYLSASELIQDLRKAITNPNDDFVKIPPMVVNDSPTIHISDDEINHIKTASKEHGNTSHLSEQEDDLSDEAVDGEEEEDVDPRIEKLMIAGGIAVAIILVLVIIFLISKFLLPGGDNSTELPSPSPTIEATEVIEATPTPEAVSTEIVPDVAGMSLEDAKKQLEDLGFEVRYTEESSDYYESGLVMKQDPDKNTEAEVGSIVKIVLSTGAESFLLPDVYGKTLTEADTTLESDNGLKITHEFEYSDTVAVDMVIRTNPEKGTAVKKGDSVVIVISRGKEVKYTQVPDLYNRTEQEAIDALKASNLVVGTTKYKYSDTVAEGRVSAQSYSAYAQVEEGTSVDFTVSLGPEVIEPEYKYEADVTIQSPFEFEDETGIVEIVLEQDGKKKTVYNSEADMSTFPFDLTITGYSESDGTLTTYVDGEEVNEQTISFDKVEI